MTSAADVAGLLGRDRLPVRRRAGHGHLPGARDAAPAAARGRARHRQDRAGRGARRGLDLPLVRLQCYEGIDATQALYDWDFPRQILHLRALEAAGGGRRRRGGREEPVRRAVPARAAGAGRAPAEPGACCWSTRSTGPTTSSRRSCSRCCRPSRSRIPELGTVKAATPPVVVLTSNRTRELHDALKRRCLYHWIDHPGLERELADRPLPRARGLRGAGRQVVGVVQQLRDRATCSKPPGVAETLDWARALHHLGTAELDLESAAAHARRAGEVPRGRRPREAGARPDAADMSASRGSTARAASAAATRSCSPSPARCGPAACRSPRTATTTSSPPPPLLGARRPRAPSASPAAPTLCAGPDDLARFDQVFEAFFNARDGLPRPRPVARPEPTVRAAPARRRRGRAGRAGRRGGPRRGQRHRGAPPPRRRLAVARRRSTGSPRCSRPSARARRCVVRPGTSAGTAARSTPRAPCARSLRRMGEPAEIAWRRRGARSRVAWCCWSTCQRLDERRTPTRCCGLRTG